MVRYCAAIGTEMPGYTRVDPDTTYPDQTGCDDGPCAGPFKCYTNGTDHQCVGVDETPPNGWTTDGVEHATRADCAAVCPPDPDSWEVGCCFWEVISDCDPDNTGRDCFPCGDKCFVGQLNVPHLICFGRNNGDDVSDCEKVVDWCTETIYNVCNDLVFETASVAGCNWSGDRSPCNNPDLPDWWKPSGGTRKTPTTTGVTTRRLTRAEIDAMSKNNPLP